MNTCIKQRCIKLIKSDSKYIYNVIKYLYIKKKLFNAYLYSPKIPEKNALLFAQKYVATLILRRNYSWSANQHIRMISEETCDTEDWSNDDDFFFFSFDHRNKLHFKIYLNSKRFF